MKKTGIIFLLILISTNIFAKINFLQNDSLYVWAENGLNLREKPDLNSKIIRTIKFGELIYVDSIADSKTFEVEFIKKIKVNHIDDNIFSKERENYSYSINGQMIKVRYKDTEGYVFSGFISKLKPVKEFTSLINLKDYFELEYGLLKKIESRTDFKYFGQLIYKNGVNCYINSSPGSFDTTFILFNISFNEGLLLVYSFIERTNNIIDKATNSRGKWYINAINDEQISFSEEYGMYNAGISKNNDLIFISISGSN
ncbi:SH3 domain-containing protein [Perlabentimonas gracilis]|uniref:SH3 domain-containing protein n=1 Tax=Perlabentimonas gracilis TaxID=2715279 RepID=UPI00140D3F78|nr:SH3 domain-containing protein [Perlabentimonas gracilis]NHB70238.1 SH3 domain-containing protein [Perlabentimonas gracilis]